MRLRKRLTQEKAEFLGLEPREKTGEGNPKYDLTQEQYNLLEEHFNYPQLPKKRKFVETQVKKGKDGEVVSTIEKLQSKPIDIPENFEVIKISNSKTTGQQWVQYAPKQVEEEIKETDFEAIIKKYIKPLTVAKKEIVPSIYTFDRLVYSDAHIGMEPNENGFGLYGGKWDEDEVNQRLNEMVTHVLSTKKSGTLVIDELGDFVDGWNAETVRKGHHLPQNMDNEKAFDVAFGFKIKLIDALAPHYNDIICNSLCNDNHAGSFAYVVNSPAKTFIETRYNHVTVNVLRRFISHYTIGKNCFILTHGKDGKHLKFGFKPILDTKQSEKIDNYIKEHRLYDYIIEFSKGDSHQKIFDESTSDFFDYYNYPAFSPSSEWVQTNFKKGMSGFEFFNFKEDGQKIHNPYKFEWVK